MWNRTSIPKSSVVEDQPDFDASEIFNQLEIYKQRDPHYKTAIENFAQAEVKHPDLVEGKPYLLKINQSTGPAEHKKRRSLNARVG